MSPGRRAGNPANVHFKIREVLHNAQSLAHLFHNVKSRKISP